MTDQITIEETELVHAGIGGDQTAVAALLQNNWSWLRAFVQSILGNINDTEDVLQNICLRVMSRIDTLQKPDSFRPWLAVVARREALSYRKKNKKETIPFEEYIKTASSETDDTTPLKSSLEKEQQSKSFGCSSNTSGKI